jgi:hypothetical protein
MSKRILRGFHLTLADIGCTFIHMKNTTIKAAQTYIIMGMLNSPAGGQIVAVTTTKNLAAAKRKRDKINKDGPYYRAFIVQEVG